MVRRRMASPKPSAPVRASSPSYKRSNRSSGFGAPAAPQPTRTYTPATYNAPPPASRGPGLMGQMAATAGGVAIGSAVGHAVGNLMTSGGHEGSATAPAPLQAPQSQQMLSNPCEFEWKQFIECSQTAGDLKMCEAYNDVFKQCRMQYNTIQNN